MDGNSGPKPARVEHDLNGLYEDVLSLRDKVATIAGTSAIASDLPTSSPARAALYNLACYMALRHRDIRDLQRRLMACGLSSLGRLEGRVLPTLDAVLAMLAAATGRPAPYAAPAESAFFAGEERLRHATDDLFGAPRRNRRGRIMVTLPSEAATDPQLVLDLARGGMDVARINCAHDSQEAWWTMADHLAAASAETGHRIRIVMDIAGPKIRTGAVVGKKDARLQKGDLFTLVANGEPVLEDDIKYSAVVSLPEIVTRLKMGDRLRYNDGKMEGEVIATTGRSATIRVGHVKAGGTKLKPEKGLNLPDTVLGLSPLTAKDESDLAAVVAIADIIGYSFVSRAEDLDLLEAAVAQLGPAGRRLGLIAKIEQPEAVRNLPGLIARARQMDLPFGVMIARGDLAAELGFARVAEMQEEILWICEAASVPAIWATQVLENLVKTGLPSRGEMTDAAMASRAECVMLNKGPAVVEAVAVLDTLLQRMDDHIFKKTPTLRALQSW